MKMKHTYLKFIIYKDKDMVLVVENPLLCLAVIQFSFPIGKSSGKVVPST